MAIPRTQRPFFLPLLFSLPPQVQKMTFWQPHKCFSGSAHISQETGFSCRVKGKKKGALIKHLTQLPWHTKGRMNVLERTRHTRKKEGRRLGEQLREPGDTSLGQMVTKTALAPLSCASCPAARPSVTSLIPEEQEKKVFGKFVVRAACQGWVAEGSCQLHQHLCMSHLAVSSWNQTLGLQSKRVDDITLPTYKWPIVFCLPYFVGFICLSFFWVQTQSSVQGAQY